MKRAGRPGRNRVKTVRTIRQGMGGFNGELGGEDCRSGLVRLSCPPMSTRWDDRYRHDRYFYGTSPNALVAEALSDLPAGRGLYVAEGEGRNAVYAAGLGHEVTAFDSSVEGRRKALTLAADRGVEIDYLVCDAADAAWEATAPFDHVVLCFFHPSPATRPALHARFAAALAPGGRLIVVSFAKEQLSRGTGGPQDLDLLHDLDEIRDEFPAVDWSRAETLETEQREGPGHDGVAVVNVLVGTRRAT